MKQGLGALADNIKKREEAQKAAEGKSPEPIAAAPVAEKPKPTPKKATPPAKPYAPIAEKTPEQKELLRKEMEAELALRARNRGQSAGGQK